MLVQISWPSSSDSTSSAPASIAASSTLSASPALAGYSIRPRRSKPWLTLPPAPRLPPFLEKIGADVGGGAVAVVGQRLDDQRDAARAEALVADFLIILGVAAPTPCRSTAGYCPWASTAALAAMTAARSRAFMSGIGQAHLGRDGDFAAELGEHRRALFVLRALAVHDVLEFGMAGHGCSLTPRPSAAR